MSPRNTMILCLVCLAAVGMFFVAGCTTTPPAGNATPTKAPNATTAAPTMNNSILKVNNNYAPNLSANATAATPAANTTANVTATKTAGGNVTIPIINVTVPQVNITLPKLNGT